MIQTPFSERILLSITGETSADWKSKLDEINKLGIDKIAVFLERFDKKERENLYPFLLKSTVKSVPFVHLRDDTGKKDIEFFISHFNTAYFNIHEEHFRLLGQWQGFLDKLYLEMSYDGQVAKKVKIEKIGGFCIDFSHFKSSLARGGDEVYYAFLKKEKIRFACNHLNGYSPELKRDLHTVKNLKDFDYLTSLPKYLFGQVIALEVTNSIAEQIKFKEYLVKMLDNYFEIKN